MGKVYSDLDGMQLPRQNKRARFSMEAAIRERSEPLDDSMAKRREDLCRILTRNGMELRDDSRLAYKYITRGEDDLSLVADELLSVNFLYSHTDYANIVQDGLRKIANQTKFMYPNIIGRKRPR